MTPKPQANKTVREELAELFAVGRMYGKTSLGAEAWTKEIDESAKDIEALISKARANERQAMLDALPKRKTKVGLPNFDSLDSIIPTAKAVGFNDAIDQMESAIKLRGGDDE